MHDAFISHSGIEFATVLEIAGGLEAAGYTTWYYERDNVPGESFLIQVGLAIEASRCVVLLVSRNSLASNQVTSEVLRTYEAGIPIMPLLLDVTHCEVQTLHPVWRQALVTSTSLALLPGCVGATLPRIVRGLENLGIRPSAPTWPEHAKPAPGRSRRTRRISPAILLLPVALVAGLFERHGSRPRPPRPKTRPPKPGPSPNIETGLFDGVHFGVTTPTSMAPGMSYVIDVWAFLERQRDVVQARAHREAGKDVRMKSQGPAPLASGARLRVRLSVAGLEIRPAHAWMLWGGEPTNSSFAVHVPPDMDAGQETGEAVISASGIPIMRVQFTVVIGAHAPDRLLGQATEARRRTAFASYASADRRAVLARVQGLSKAGVDVFVDVMNLRSGERYEKVLLETLQMQDVFYLFWSRAAMQSPWVEREWRCALSTRGIDFIDPIPLVSPERVPPPSELASELHFNDWHLAYLEAREAQNPWQRLWARVTS